MEHNYSALSRPKLKKTVKWAFNEGEIKARHIKVLQSEVCRLRKKSGTLKQRLAEAQRVSGDAAFQYLTRDMKKSAKLFIQMQKQNKKTPKGRRFSIEEKILCLSLFKKSPKCYRMLSKYFTLPSSRAMTRLLSNIKIGEGINKLIFDKIKHGLRDQDVSQRLCTLIFDEMSLTPQIFYNAAGDNLSGFAHNQKSAFTDHVLVFMVKGVRRNFKQPVAYYFTNGLKKKQFKRIDKNCY
ncbi:hypothetical protein evm_014543 [Chilo suppressalis]|nr:hypothetical protein evm_014543 [Chilo suppressalis]